MVVAKIALFGNWIFRVPAHCEFYWFVLAREEKHSWTSEKTAWVARTRAETKPEAGARRGDGEIAKG